MAFGCAEVPGDETREIVDNLVQAGFPADDITVNDNVVARGEPLLAEQPDGWPKDCDTDTTPTCPNQLLAERERTLHAGPCGTPDTPMCPHDSPSQLRAELID